MTSKEHNVNLRCAFCGKSQRDVHKLFAGPAAYICTECVKVCRDIISQQMNDPGEARVTARALAKTAQQLAHDLSALPTLPRSIVAHALLLAKELESLEPNEVSPPRSKRRHDLCCSFCGRTQHEVQYLIAGPSVYICDECVSLFESVLALENTDLQEFAGIARRLSVDVKKCSTIPSAIADRASLLAAELDRLATPDKPQ